VRALAHRKRKGRRSIHGNKIEQQQEQENIIEPQQVFKSRWNNKPRRIKPRFEEVISFFQAQFGVGGTFAQRSVKASFISRDSEFTSSSDCQRQQRPQCAVRKFESGEQPFENQFTFPWNSRPFAYIVFAHGFFSHVVFADFRAQQFTNDASCEVVIAE
jgi:hypothetical protein